MSGWISIGACAQTAAPDTTITPPLPQGFDPSNATPIQPPNVKRTKPGPAQQTVVVSQPVAISQPVARPSAVQPPPAAVLSGGELAFDEAVKSKEAKPGEAFVSFSFAVTNVSEQEVAINMVRTSCGCTVAQLPATPWHLPPGEGGTFGVTMNVAGKHGSVTKSVTVFSTAGTTNLLVTSVIPEGEPDSPSAMDRLRNQRIAAADRQVVFRGECGSCHTQPTVGKLGADLYKTACGICHEAEHRATMVPDLHALAQPGTSEYWDEMVVHGKPGTLMPAFSKQEGGPLSQDQIDSLVDYLVHNFKPTTGNPATPVDTTAPAHAGGN